VAARQLCGHALDARDPHHLFDQVDLARGVGTARRVGTIHRPSSGS
jgi:hypothetical protein